MDFWQLAMGLGSQKMVTVAFKLRNGSVARGVHLASNVNGLGQGTFTLMEPASGNHVTINTADIQAVVEFTPFGGSGGVF